MNSLVGVLEYTERIRWDTGFETHVLLIGKGYLIASASSTNAILISDLYLTG